MHRTNRFASQRGWCSYHQLVLWPRQEQLVRHDRADVGASGPIAWSNTAVRSHAAWRLPGARARRRQSRDDQRDAASRRSAAERGDVVTAAALPIGLSPAEAIEYFRRKGYEISFAWQDLLHAAHA